MSLAFLSTGVRIENKAADGALIEFDGGLIQHVAQKGHFPILVQSGGVHFKDTVVRDSGKRNWLEPGWRSASPVTNVEGTVTVYSTNGRCTEGWNATRGDEHNLVVTCKQGQDHFEKLQAIVRTNAKTDDEVVANCCPAGAKTVDASCWLPQAKSSESQDVAVQAAVDCGAPVVTVPARAGGEPWIFNQSVVLRDGVTVKLDSGVQVQALRGSMHPSGSHLFSMSNVSDVTVSGYGATLQMWKEDYNDPAKYKHSEWRHGIDISSSHNILVEGVTVTQVGHDNQSDISFMNLPLEPSLESYCVT